jgi:hypothetical protein
VSALHPAASAAACRLAQPSCCFRFTLLQDWLPFSAVQDGAGLLPAYRGTLDALRQIVRQEGWRALYSGRRCCTALPLGVFVALPPCHAKQHENA